MKLTTLRSTIAIIFYLALAACGGGGTSSPQPAPTPTPPPPTPTLNTPPVVSYSISSDTLNEGETFFIDARASNDPDGQVVSITAENDFNPFFPEYESVQVNIGTHPEGVFEFLVPEVFRDLQGIFKITVTDDRGGSSVESAYLTFRSTLNEPKIDGFGGPYSIIDSSRPLHLLGGIIGTLLAVEPTALTPSGNQTVVVAADENNLIANKTLESDSTVTGEVSTKSTLFPDALNFNLSPATPFQFTVVSEDGNAVHWFADIEAIYPDDFELQQTIDIERPCYIAPRVNTGQDFVWIGQRRAGLSVVQIDRYIPPDLAPDTPNSHWARGFDYTVKSRAGGNRSLCYVYPTVLPDRLSDPLTRSALSDLIAVDYDSNELVLLVDEPGNDEQYEEVEVLALDTGGIQGLKIVDVRGVGNPSLFPNFLLVLMSDGIDNGEHRLVIVEQIPFTHEISQSSITIEGGAPTQMVTPGSLFGAEGKLIDHGIDMVIISSNSNQAIILEDERADLELDFGPPIYKPPQHLDIGFGAGSAIPLFGVFGDSDPRVAILVSYPEIQELKLWLYRD